MIYTCCILCPMFGLSRLVNIFEGYADRDVDPNAVAALNRLHSEGILVNPFSYGRSLGVGGSTLSALGGISEAIAATSVQTAIQQKLFLFRPVCASKPITTAVLSMHGDRIRPLQTSDEYATGLVRQLVNCMGSNVQGVRHTGNGAELFSYVLESQTDLFAEPILRQEIQVLAPNNVIIRVLPSIVDVKDISIVCQSMSMK